MQQAETTTWGASPTAIQSHYDVGNDFYAQWLDETRTYSCGLWHGDEDLHTAQLQKLDWHLNGARARNATRLLDIGCGWGSLLKRAVAEHGVHNAVGLSLSEAQSAWIREMNLPNTQVHVQSWADYVPDAPFDAIISIGAFEHFARIEQSLAEKQQGYRAFFEACHRMLVPGGRMSLQTITYENADREDFSRFFADRIFPESDLPHHAEIFQASKGLFEVEMLRNDREHYARTARCWLSNLRKSRATAVALVGEAEVATFEKYLSLLVVGFHTGRMNLARLILRRIDLSTKPTSKPATGTSAA
jgi:cyclopropane-fatty-acyl-phospholipid synthase